MSNSHAGIGMQSSARVNHRAIFRVDSQSARSRLYTNELLFESVVANRLWSELVVGTCELCSHAMSVSSMISVVLWDFPELRGLISRFPDSIRLHHARHKSFDKCCPSYDQTLLQRTHCYSGLNT